MVKTGPTKRSSGLDVWLATGRKINIGGRELYMMPLPLKYLKQAMEAIESVTQDFVKDFVVKADKGELNILSVARDVLDSFNSTEVAFKLFMLCKDPDTGQPINQGLTMDWLEENLDLPTARRIIVDFVEVNELEDALKKAQDLPVLKGLVEALTMTYGISLLNSSRQSMALLQGRSESSPSPKSQDTPKPVEKDMSQPPSTEDSQTMGGTLQ